VRAGIHLTAASALCRHSLGANGVRRGRRGRRAGCWEARLRRRRDAFIIALHTLAGCSGAQRRAQAPLSTTPVRRAACRARLSNSVLRHRGQTGAASPLWSSHQLDVEIWKSFLKHLNLEASDKIKKMNSDANQNGGRRFPPWVIKKMGTSDDKERTIYVIKTKKSGGCEARQFSRFHGYDPQRHLFARIAFTAPDAARVVVGLLERPTVWMKKRLAHQVQTTFELAEATLDVTTQACADMGLTPGGWFALRAGIRPDARGKSYLDVRVSRTYRKVAAKDVVPMPERTGLAPLKVLSFDLYLYPHSLRSLRIGGFSLQ
jgi:hypothetical protein